MGAGRTQSVARRGRGEGIRRERVAAELEEGSSGRAALAGRILCLRLAGLSQKTPGQKVGHPELVALDAEGELPSKYSLEIGSLVLDVPQLEIHRCLGAQVDYHR